MCVCVCEREREEEEIMVTVSSTYRNQLVVGEPENTGKLKLPQGVAEPRRYQHVYLPIRKCSAGHEYGTQRNTAESGNVCGRKSTANTKVGDLDGSVEEVVKCVVAITAVVISN